MTDMGYLVSAEFQPKFLVNDKRWISAVNFDPPDSVLKEIRLPGLLTTVRVLELNFTLDALPDTTPVSLTGFWRGA